MSDSATPEALVAAIPDFTDEELGDLMLNFVKNGKTLKDIRGLTADNMEAIYGVAYNAYHGGNLAQALKVFQFLCYFDHLERKYWIGLGATRQMLKDFSGAVDAYSYAALLNVHDPRPPFQAANCHIALGNREAAISGLTAAVEFSADKAEWASLKTQANAMLGLLQSSARQRG